MDLKNTFIQIISIFFSKYLLFRIIYEKCYTNDEKKSGNNIVCTYRNFQLYFNGDTFIQL